MTRISFPVVFSRLDAVSLSIVPVGCCSPVRIGQVRPVRQPIAITINGEVE